jgi:hypothetical protein
MITPHPVKTQSPAPASARRPVPRALGIGTPRIIAGCALAAPAAGHHACSRRLGSRPHWARESCGPIGNIETCRRCDSINGPLYVTESSSDSRRPRRSRTSPLCPSEPRRGQTSRPSVARTGLGDTLSTATRWAAHGAHGRRARAPTGACVGESVVRSPPSARSASIRTKRINAPCDARRLEASLTW